MKKIGVYVGRLNPMHLGHEAVIRYMIDTFGDNCLLVLGSVNNPTSIRHFFSYDERKQFIKKVFPTLKIAPLSDFSNDRQWLDALDDIIENTFHTYPDKEILFMGGCEEDVRFFLDDGRKIHIMNRFTGETPKVSATEVRDALVSQRDITHLVNPMLASDIQESFAKKREIFKKQ